MDHATQHAREMDRIRQEAAEQRQLFIRLAWVHGEDRAREIIEGRDQRANEDLRQWRRVLAL